MGSCLATYFKPHEQGVRGTRYKRVATDSTRTTYGSGDRTGTTSNNRYSDNDVSASSSAKCQACGLNFDTKSQLSAHIAATHGGNIEKQVKKNRKKEKDNERRKEERVNLYKDIKNGDVYSNGNAYPTQSESSPPQKKASRWSQSKNYIKSKIPKVKLPPRKTVENYVESLLRDKPRTVDYARASQQTKKKKKKKKKKNAK